MSVPDKEAAPKLSADSPLELPPVVYGGDELLIATPEIERALSALDEAWVGRMLAAYEAGRHSLPVFTRDADTSETSDSSPDTVPVRPGSSTALCEELWPASVRASAPCRVPTWKEFAEGYRLLLFVAGVEIRLDAHSESRGRRGFGPERFSPKRKSGGKAKVLPCRLTRITLGSVAQLGESLIPQPPSPCS